MERWIQ